MATSFQNPECGCVIKQAFIDFADSSDTRGELIANYYGCRNSNTQSGHRSKRLAELETKLIRQFYFQFLSFLDETNRPIRMDAMSFAWLSDIYFDRQFRSHTYEG